MCRIVILAGVLFAGGCGIFIYGPAKTMEADELPSPNSAFLYGRFKNYDETYVGRARSGFVIHCDDNRDYIIEFGPTTPQVIPISPARCALLGKAFLDHQGFVRRDNPFGTSMKPVQFMAGKAYYLGDFAYSYSRTYDPTTKIYSEEWKLSEAADEYQATTDQMRVMYPLFKDIPTEKKLVSETIMSSDEIAERKSQDVEEFGRREKLCSDDNERCRASCNDATDRVSCLRDCGAKKSDCTKKLPGIRQ